MFYLREWTVDLALSNTVMIDFFSSTPTPIKAALVIEDPRNSADWTEVG